MRGKRDSRSDPHHQPGKDALIDYFDRGAELEELLERKGRWEELR